LSIKTASGVGRREARPCRGLNILKLSGLFPLKFMFPQKLAHHWDARQEGSGVPCQIPMLQPVPHISCSSSGTSRSPVGGRYGLNMCVLAFASRASSKLMTGREQIWHISKW
jgi:hypothetical protein